MVLTVHIELNTTAQYILPKDICSGYAVILQILQPAKPFRQHNKMGGKVNSNIYTSKLNRVTSVKVRCMARVRALVKVKVRALPKAKAKTLVKVKVLGRGLVKVRAMVKTLVKVKTGPRTRTPKEVKETEDTTTKEVSSRPD